jgi:preprotein translocase subunit SecE
MIAYVTAPGGVLKLPACTGRPKLFMNITNYFREVRAEMRHVSWPTRNQAVVYTIVVVVVSLVTAAYLGLWDYVFTVFIQRII